VNKLGRVCFDDHRSDSSGAHELVLISKHRLDFGVTKSMVGLKLLNNASHGRKCFKIY